MPQKKSDNSYENFNVSLKAGKFEKFYIFHGEERYLLDHGLGELRKRLCPDGLNGFNYKRFEGKSVAIDDLAEAIDMMPVFAERTLIEVHDFDIFKGKRKAAADATEDGGDEDAENDRTVKSIDDKEKNRLLKVLSELPEYVCIVFIYSTLVYKPDGRLKADKEILKYAQVVDFSLQEQGKLVNWIIRRFSASGKRISRPDAEYMAMIADGYMEALIGEIDKVSAFSDEETVSRSDIDSVVTPALNAFAYKLTDAILQRRHVEAMRILDELFLMREPPQKILFSISLKMRQLLAARVCLDNKLGKYDLMDICGIKYDFQAGMLMDTARKATVAGCCDAVKACARAALDINNSSASEPEARLVELLARLSM